MAYLKLTSRVLFEMSAKTIAIVRPDSNPVNLKFYNSQEVGLAKALAKKGVNVDIFMSGFPEKSVKMSKIPSDCGAITIYEMPCIVIPEISHAIYPDLISFLKKKKYDLIQVNEENELTCFWVARFASRNGINCVLYQGMYKQITGRIRAAFQLIYDTFLLPAFRKNIHLALTKTTRAETHLRGKGFKRIKVLPVGLDVEVFNNQEHVDWRSKYSIRHDARILLYVGIFESRRNVHFLVEIAEKLAQKNYHLIMAGDGPLIEELRNKIASNDINNVTLTGTIPQKNIMSLFSLADLFLLASDYEIYGMVVLEALFAGCPVISTRTAGPEDLIKDGINGMLLDEIDVNLWVDTIKSSIGGFDRKKIKLYAEKNLSWDSVADRYIQLTLR